MPIDPRDYDVEELRETAGELSLEEVAAAAAEPSSRRVELDDPPATGTGGSDGLRRELAILERATGGPDERPYLEHVPGSFEAETTAMEWVDELVRSVGLDGTRSALRYYRSVGWIGRAVEETLMDHAAGLADEREHATGDLDWADHRVALRYVARLAALSGDGGDAT